MKALYVGAYRDGTGWSHASLEYMSALIAAGIDVVPRHFRYSPNQTEIPSHIEERESQSSKGCDFILEHILPEHMEYSGYFKKNVGLYCTETSHFRRSNWASNLNLMDELWVPNHQMVTAARDSHVEVPIHVVPIPCDISKYSQRYEPYPIPALRDSFVFYTIGELNRRKNLVALLKAFHLEFNLQEPVSLLIKCSLPGHSPAEANQHVLKIINDVKEQLKLYPSNSIYHQEIIITQRLTEQEMMRLHATCNCFVAPSFGEAWSIPAFDAMAMGKTPICTDVGGMHDFLVTKVQCPPLSIDFDGRPIGEPIYKTAGWLVPGYPTPVFGMTEGFPHYLFTGDETWWDIDINMLRCAMRTAFCNEKIRQEKSTLGIDRAYDFSYEVVGNQMKELLCTNSNQ